MGKTNAFAGRTGMFLMVCVAAIVSLSACGINDPDHLAQELSARHFRDVTKVLADSGSAKEVYWVTVGHCRLRAIYYHNGKASWTIQDPKSGQVIVTDPIAVNVDEDPHFAECMTHVPVPSTPGPKS